MAKIISLSVGKNSIDCLLSGTLGDKVYYVRNGIQYSRTRPVPNPKQRTAAQIDQRAKFAATLKFLQPLTAFLRVGFASQAVDMSPFNAAMSCNNKLSITGPSPDYRIDYSKVLLTCGKHPGALNPKIKSTIAGEIEFAWDNNSIVNDARADDMVLLVVYNLNKHEAITVIGGNTRISGNQVIALPLTFKGDELQCYIAFHNFKQSDVSNSQYVGSLQV